MKILVTGGNGQLGRSLRTLAAGSGHEFVFTDVEELDITDEAAVNAFVRNTAPDIIVNCAAYTDVERAEDNPDLAHRLNADAAAFLACASRENDALLIHVSTDYVFGGDTGNIPRDESTPPSPTGVYGITKLEGERKVLESGCRSIIIRTAWLYSGYGRNFLKTMLSLTASKPQLKVVFDQAGTPTYALDLAHAVMTVIDTPDIDTKTGIYHFSDEGVCSWYDFTIMIARLAGHDKCDIQPCHSDEFPSKVKRPSYSVLDKTRFRQVFGVKIPYWVDSLQRCLADMKDEQDR